MVFYILNNLARKKYQEIEHDAHEHLREKKLEQQERIKELNPYKWREE